MAWDNGPAPWAEVERVLSGRPPRPGQPLLTTREGQPEPPPAEPPTPPVPGPLVPYAELHAHSAFSFLDGASQPEAMAAEAARLGLTALAITDHDGLYGAVGLAEAAREHGLGTVFGSELSIGLSGPQNGMADPEGQHLLILARGQEGYRRLSRAIAEGQMAGGEKGRPVYDLDRLASWAGDGHWVVLTGCRKGAVRAAAAAASTRAGRPAAARQALIELVDRFGSESVVVELTRHMVPTDDEDNDLLAALAAEAGLPVVATTGAHYACPEDGLLGSAMAAVRARRSLDELDGWLPAGHSRFLRSGAEMAALFARYSGAVHTAHEIGVQCAFDLKLVAPKLPPYDVPVGHDEASWLRHLAHERGLARFGPPESNPSAYKRLDKELKIITDLGFPGYFLVVADIVDFCREHDILCQGRGSAATSAVCYALGITAIDAHRYNLVFERFLSAERDGPPDIDIDIESDRREEVIQFVYARHGRDRAALVANVNTYRPRSAVRDMAKALGYSEGQQDAMSKSLDGWTPLDAQPAGEIPVPVLELARQLEDLPRHLSIHPGGMVICDRPVADVVPTEWARMADRTILQWDKDDCADVGIVKFDLLGLGMLSAIHYTLDLVAEHEGLVVDLAQLDLEESAVYDMLCRADTVGVFQVESRAQMATLPRLKPRRFYDLAIEIALIRPGPIQGGSVHPFIRRHAGQEEPTVEHPAMWPALRKTLGVPLFQEQLMELAVDVAGFGPGEADELRRAMGSKRSTTKMHRLKDRLYQGMRELHGIRPPIADRIFEKMLAFANYGFAESHALSFAGIVFHSAWLKLHHPAAFLAGLLRAQPMGFYSPQSLVADARRHGVTVHRPDINHSNTRTDLDHEPGGNLSVRLGLDQIRGISTTLAEHIIAARPTTGYQTIDQLTQTVDLTTPQVEALATAGALDTLTPDPHGTARRQALWAAGAASRVDAGMLPGSGSPQPPPELPGMSITEIAAADLWATGITPNLHPAQFARPQLDQLGAQPIGTLQDIDNGTRILTAGAVTHRQRPTGTVVFISLEDETGLLNVICPAGLYTHVRARIRDARALLVRGIVQRQDGALSVLADRITPIQLAASLPSRDWH